MAGGGRLWRGISIPVALAASAWLAACGGAFEEMAPADRAQPALAPVPALEGASLPEARQRLEQAGFRLGRVEERAAAKSPPGRILRQSPAGHEAAIVGAPVDVVVAVKPVPLPLSRLAPPVSKPAVEMVTVPDLRKAPLDGASGGARHRLRGAGLRVGALTEIVTGVAAYRGVVDQHPAPGKRVRRGTPVDLVIARAPDPGVSGVPVPDLTGRDRAAATQVLRWAGLGLGTVREQATRRNPAGTVLGQYPAPSQRLAPGQRVDILVARAPDKPRPLTSIPDLTGLEVAAVERALRRAGLRLGKVQEIPATGVPEGTVARQRPAPAKRVAEGEPVDILVARAGYAAPAGMPVPGVVGLPLEKARQVLARLGLRLGEVSGQATRREAAGTVIAQSPSPGEFVRPEARIDVVTARAPDAPRPAAEVPDLLGLPVAAAREAIERAGLSLGQVRRRRARGRQPRGTVVAQIPPPQSRVERGRPVDLVVARGEDG